MCENVCFMLLRKVYEEENAHVCLNYYLDLLLRVFAKKK